MSRRLTTILLSTAAGLMLLSHAGKSGAQSILATGPEAEVTGDGLHRVNPSIMENAWVKPDLDLSVYSRIYFVPVAVQFRDVAERRYTARTRDTAEQFFVTEQRKARLRDLFGEAFHEAVGEIESYELSEEVGRDVLIVRGLLADVISGVPPDDAGSVSSSVRWAWEASIVLELRDSMSNDILARTADRERIDGPFDVGAMMGVTASVAQSWSRLLAGRVEEVSELGAE